MFEFQFAPEIFVLGSNKYEKGVITKWTLKCAHLFTVLKNENLLKKV